jgi:hypothetical protein
MALAERVLAGTPTGRLTAVVGRPASGVSGLLSAVVSAAGNSRDHRTRAVLASWEGSQQHVETLDTRHVAVPEIINWNVDELARCRDLVDAPEGTVVAVDYLQLVGPADETAADLRALASQHRWRLVVGVMAPRNLTRLDSDLHGRPAAGRSGLPFVQLGSRLLVRRVDLAEIVGVDPAA